MKAHVKNGGKMELAILGLGRWGGGPLLKTLSQLVPDVPIHGFARSNYAEWKKKTDLSDHIRIHGACEYQSALLDNAKIKAVFISTESTSHYRFAKEMLLAGKDVLVEKPIAQTKEEAADLLESAVKQRRILSVGYTLMYDPNVNLLKRVMTSPVFKKVDEITLNLLNPLTGRELDFTSTVIEDFVPHMLSILHVLLGVRKMTDISDIVVDTERKEHAKISFSTKGLQVTLDVDRDYQGHRKERIIKVRGLDWVIEVDLIHETFIVSDRKGVVLDQNNARYPQTLLEQTKSKFRPLELEFMDFLESIKTRQLPRNAAALSPWIPETIDKIMRMSISR